VIATDCDEETSHPFEHAHLFGRQDRPQRIVTGVQILHEVLGREVELLPHRGDPGGELKVILARSKTGPGGGAASGSSPGS